MAKLKDERVYKSKAGFFHVFKLKSSFGVYNGSGVKIAEVSDVNARAVRMAQIIADALELEFQY